MRKYYVFMIKCVLGNMSESSEFTFENSFKLTFIIKCIENNIVMDTFKTVGSILKNCV